MTPRAFGEDERLVRCFATEMVGRQGGRLAGLMVLVHSLMVPVHSSMVLGQGSMVPGQESNVAEGTKEIVAVRVDS